MKNIILIVGAPASGKSTAGKYIVSLLKRQGKKVIHLNEVDFIETVVKLYDPDMNHVYEDTDGTLVFKDSFTLEKMNEFIFKFAITISPDSFYVIELGRGGDANSIASTYMKSFEQIPESLYEKVQVVHVKTDTDKRMQREIVRRGNGDQYCPNIETYEKNDLEEVKQKFHKISFTLVENNKETADYYQQLNKIFE